MYGISPRGNQKNCKNTPIIFFEYRETANLNNKKERKTFEKTFPQKTRSSLVRANISVQKKPRPYARFSHCRFTVIYFRHERYIHTGLLLCDKSWDRKFENSERIFENLRNIKMCSEFFLAGGNFLDLCFVFFFGEEIVRHDHNREPFVRTYHTPGEMIQSCIRIRNLDRRYTTTQCCVAPPFDLN